MRVVPRSALRPGFGAADDSNTEIKIQPSAAAAGLGLWVAAGVITHVIVRVLDRWLFNDR